MAGLPSATKLLLAIILSLFVFLALIFFSGAEKVLSSLSSFPLWAIPILIALTALAYFLRIARWQFLLKASSVNLSLKSLALPFLISQTASLLTPGKAGDPLRCFLLKEKKRKTLGSVVVERLLDFLLLTALAASFLLPSNSTAIIPILAAAALVASSILLFSSQRIAKAVWLPLSKIKFLKTHESQLKEFYHSVRSMALKPDLFLSAILTASIWALDFTRLALIFTFLSSPVPSLLVAQIFSAALIVGTLSMIPGGMGGQEAVMIALFSTAGIALPIISAAIIIDRLVSYWLPIAVGSLLLPYK